MFRTLAETCAQTARAHQRIFVAAVLAVALSTWAIAAVVVWLVAGIARTLPDDDALRSIGSMARATTVYDANGTAAFTIFKEQRIEIPLSRVSPHLIDAIVAVEDQRFFDHGGVDVIRVAGAAWSNLREGWGAQGASTITQQLARQSFLTRDKTLRRKLTEVVLAARIERAFTKPEILELYLNKVYFGDGLYGVEAASLGYLGKHAADLDVADAALLAGLVKAPSSYAPTVNIDRARARRNAALDAMRSAGSIDAPTYQMARGQDIQLQDALRHEESYGQYFKEEVRKELVQRFGWARVYEGGLRVYTTLDLDLQKAAESEVARAIDEIEQRQARGRRGAPPADDSLLQAALVAMDPVTGEVRAMVGGRSFDESRFNRVTQARRQAGSAFKPFVYAAAIERGYSPATIIRALDTPIMTLQGAWVPDDHSSGTAMTMRAALKNSSNRAAVRMLQDIGIPAALRAAERLGIEDVPGVPSLALGSGEVTLMSMTAAYAAFANEGVRPTPTLIRRVETTEGEVLYTAAPRGDRAVSEATAFLITHMLADVVDGGTAWQARRVGFKLPAAGKTGTTNDYRDAWFVGYTPHLATGVWVGYDQPRTIMRDGYAGTLAVPLWGRFMATATDGHKADRFKAPRTVTSATVCRISGKRATDACRSAEAIDRDGYLTQASTAYTEYFVRGTEPDDYCPYHTHAPSGGYVARSASPSGSESRQAVSAAGASAPIATTGAFATGATGAPAAPAAASAAVAEAEPPAPRRPGFWRRFFGLGGGGRQPQPVAEPESATR